MFNKKRQVSIPLRPKGWSSLETNYMENGNYVSFKAAKLLKDKGFNDECFAYYHLHDRDGMTDEENFEVTGGDSIINSVNQYRIAAPTLIHAREWIWENYGVFVTVYISVPYIRSCRFVYLIQDAQKGIDHYDDTISDDDYGTYEEAMEQGLLYTLKDVLADREVSSSDCPVDRPDGPQITDRADSMIYHMAKYDWGTQYCFIERNGYAVGRLYTYKGENGVAYIEGLHVSDEQRKKRYGTMMLMHLIDKCTEIGAKECILWCDKNGWVYEWYKRLGFMYVEDKRDQDGYVWMRKEL